MPEASEVLGSRFEHAVVAVEEWLQQFIGGINRLNPEALSAYPRHDPVAGWRIEVQFSDSVRRLDIIVSRAFPFRAARIALVDRPPFLTWPHVERDGLLCLVPEHTTFSPDDPVGGIINLLEMAYELIEGFTTGQGDEEFKSEVLSYWANTSTYGGPALLSLVTPSGPSREIRVWWGQKSVVLADNEEDAAAWLKNRYGELKRQALEMMPGALFTLPEPLHPKDFPGTAADIYELAERFGATSVLDATTSSLPNQIVVALAMATPHGPAIAGVVVPRPPRQRGRDPLTRGFRRGHIPAKIIAQRYFSQTPVLKAMVERIDPSWIHGRGQDPRFDVLRKSTVVVLGCGSVGGPIATALAQAGVGRLILVDNDSLKGANIGRHPLGMSTLNLPKAFGLAAKVRSDFPHIAVEAHATNAERFLLGASGPLAEADLIVSAMGNWASESMLDEWHQARGKAKPIVYSWTEAHAAAGHAVTIVGSGPRLRVGLDATGLPMLQVTEWPAGPTIRQEPACGAQFEPYGPVELGYITNMASELVLDSLLGEVKSPTHRIWAGRRRLLDGAGGRWTPTWKRIAAGRQDGGFILERPWADVLPDQALAA